MYLRDAANYSSALIDQRPRSFDEQLIVVELSPDTLEQKTVRLFGKGKGGTRTVLGMVSPLHTSTP
jgi:hypothetical protein